MSEKAKRAYETQPMDGVTPWPAREPATTQEMRREHAGEGTTPLEGTDVPTIPLETVNGDAELTSAQLTEFAEAALQSHARILSDLDSRNGQTRRGAAPLELTAEMAAWIKEQEAKGSGTE